MLGHVQKIGWTCPVLMGGLYYSLGVGNFIVWNLHFDNNSLLRLYSKIIRAEGWKGQNPSKTFRFEGSFVENLQKPST